MPFARIDLAKGKAAEYRAAVAEIVYQGIVGVLKAPDNDRFVVVHEHDPENFFWASTFLGVKKSPDVIFIQVISTVGNTVEQKREFYRKMADDLNQWVGLRKEDTMINMVFVKQEDWSFGNGEPWV